MSKKKMETGLLHEGKYIFTLFLISFLFLGCNDNAKITEVVNKIDLNLQISRFDQEFAKAEPSDLPLLKKEYPYLFPTQYPDSVWVAKLKDTVQVELLREVDAEFSNFEQEETDLQLLFKHIKYYFPRFNVPKIVTVTSDVDYENRVILTDSLLLIGLDNYLGQGHKFYERISNYISAGMDKKYLVSDVASAFTKRVVPKAEDRTFLAQVVYYGKELYVKDRLTPFLSEAQRIGYSQEDLEWAHLNEEPMWRYFIERELLYDTDTKLGLRFLDPAPFSKFGLELDNESPGRIGRYLGWQIVRAFMERNEVSLQQMLGLPAEEIFKKSNYKPKK